MIQNYGRDDITFQLTPEEIAALKALREGSTGGSGGTTQKRQWEGYDMTELRRWYRAGGLSYEQWRDELIARGEAPEQATANIATALEIGVSTAKGAVPGTLTPAEQRAVDALAPQVAAEQARIAAGGGTAAANPQLMSGQSQETLAQFDARGVDPKMQQQAGQLLSGQGAAPPLGAPPSTGGAKGGTTGGRGGSSVAAPPAEKPYTFGRDSEGLPIVKIKATGQIVHLPNGTEADNLDVIMPIVQKVSAEPLKFDFYTDAKGMPRMYIYETDKLIKLPEGTAEDSVRVAHEYVRNLDKESPNLMAAMQNLEYVRRDQGHDEFNRPYQGINDQGQSFSTRYGQAPNPEDLPDYMQQELISGITAPLQGQYAKRGLDLAGMGNAQFERSQAGDQLYIDYEDPGNGVRGPVIGPKGNVFATVEEADKAAVAYGREAASRQEEEGYDDSLAPTTLTAKKAKRPLDFAYGGEMQLRRPASVVDRRSGQVIANAAMNGPERVSFGGETIDGFMGDRSQFGAPRPEMSAARMLMDRENQAQAWQTHMNQFSGMYGTDNPRLMAENPQRYFMNQEMPKPTSVWGGQGANQWRRPLNFMTNPPVGIPVERPMQGRRPVFNPQKMLDAMRT